jgi:hypothetical protein
MRTVRILTAVALGMALVALTGNVYASGGKKGNHVKGGGKVVHKHRAPIVKHYRPIVVVPVVPVVPAGSAMEVPGFYGLRPGHVVLDMHGTIVHPKVLAWTPRGVVVQIPFMKLPAPVCGKLVLIGCDKFAYRPVEVKIVPPLGGPVGPAIGPAGAPQGPAVVAVKP